MKCKYNKRKGYKKISVKHCTKCGREIEEESDVKWCMIITKRGQRIIEFECFHFECWKAFFEENVQMQIKQAE